MEFRTAGFAGWNAADRSMLIATRFGNTNQLHTVAAPLGMRRQISFEVEPVGGELVAEGRRPRRRRRTSAATSSSSSTRWRLAA